MILKLNIDIDIVLLMAKYDQYQFKNKDPDSTKEDDVTEYIIWVLKEKGREANLKEKREKVIAIRPEITDARP